MDPLILKLAKLAYSHREYRDTVLPFLLEREAKDKGTTVSVDKQEIKKKLKGLEEKPKAQRALSYALELYRCLELICKKSEEEIPKVISNPNLNGLDPALVAAYTAVKDRFNAVYSDYHFAVDRNLIYRKPKGLIPEMVEIKRLVASHINQIISNIPEKPKVNKSNKTVTEKREFQPEDLGKYIDYLNQSFKVFKYENVIFNGESPQDIKKELSEKDSEELDDSDKEKQKYLEELQSTQDNQSKIQRELKDVFDSLYSKVLEKLAGDGLASSKELFTKLVNKDSIINMVEIEDRFNSETVKLKRDPRAKKLIKDKKIEMMDKIIADFEDLKTKLK